MLDDRLPARRLRPGAVLAASLATLVLLLSGCLVSQPIASTRSDLEAHFPEARFDRTIAIQTGALTWRTFGLAGRLVTDLEERRFASYLDHVRSVDVGIYEVEHLGPEARVEPDPLLRLQQKGWRTLASLRERPDYVWVLYRAKRPLISDLYPESPIRDLAVVVLSEDELVITFVRADLRAAIQQLLREPLEDVRLLPRLESFTEPKQTDGR